MAFWKNLGRNKIRLKEDDKSSLKKPRSPSDVKDGVNKNADAGNCQSDETSRAASAVPRTSEDFVFGDLGDFHHSSSLKPRSRKSRLSKNFREIISDSTALCSFQHFMESRDLGSYVNFLNDIENFNRLASMGCSDEKENFSSVEKWKSAISPPNSTSTSSSSGFGDDSLLDSPTDHCETKARLESETLTHSLHSEALRIYEKYFDPDSNSYLNSLSETMREAVKTSLLSDNLERQCFSQPHQFVWKLLENEHFPDYLHSEYHYKHQMEILTSGKITLNDILYSDTVLFYFMEFMDQESKRHWLEFWLAADNFREQWNPDQASEDALVIYNRYFSLQAAQPIGLSDSIRSQVEENICRATVPAPDCFEHALQAVLHIMEKHYLPLFLCSQCYLQFLSEVITAMKTSTVSVAHRKRTSSESTLNSEVSGFSSTTFSNNSTQGTAFQHSHAANASGGANNSENLIVRLANSISNHSLLIDTRQLSDPDLLWRKKKYKSMSLGRISPIGRFYTEVEPYPDKKSESRFSKAVKKFVYMEEDKAKEEFAWQIAAMIVEEVFTLTRGLPAAESTEPLQST